MAILRLHVEPVKFGKGVGGIRGSKSLNKHSGLSYLGA